MEFLGLFLRRHFVEKPTVVAWNAMLAVSHPSDKKQVIAFVTLLLPFSVYLLQAANERYFETQMIYNFLKNTYMYINDTINFHWLLFPR